MIAAKDMKSPQRISLRADGAGLVNRHLLIIRAKTMTKNRNMIISKKNNLKAADL